MAYLCDLCGPLCPLCFRSLLAKRGENPVAHLLHRPEPVDPMVLRRARIARGGPLAVVLDERLGLAMIDREAIPHRLLLVVLALRERLAGHVVAARDLRRLEPQVVRAS